ncbi:DUF6154 family protein [Bacillus kwashiorkori]|uniref:DUF6154 family protein n=1 Tax=Bacillus kwashiorkori TaxID=1522318 RepID=UPI0007806A85|nr:DUF6154 family protein [Bacillus kwashiorkori]
MKFIDDVYNYYKDRLTADEEDIDLLVGAILQELSREDMLLLLAELSYEELFEITGTYMVNQLKEKMINKESKDTESIDKPNFFH